MIECDTATPKAEIIHSGQVPLQDIGQVTTLLQNHNINRSGQNGASKVAELNCSSPTFDERAEPATNGHMSAAEKGGDTYWLPRNELEMQRLDAQNLFMAKAMGYQIHPAIACKLPQSPRIADIGTGTGAWLASIAPRLPSTAQLDGFDISSAQFTSTDELPSNVRLLSADMKQPFAAEFEGQYDLVHLRLLQSVLDPGEWDTVLSNVAVLLKPGGAVQWTEKDFSRALPARRGAALPPKGDSDGESALDDMITLFKSGPNWKMAAGPFGAWSNFTGVLTNVGLADIGQDIVASDRLGTAETRKMAMDLLVNLFKTLVAKRMGERGAELAERADQAVNAGEYVTWDIYTVFGFKKEGSSSDGNKVPVYV